MRQTLTVSLGLAWRSLILVRRMPSVSAISAMAVVISWARSPRLLPRASTAWLSTAVVRGAALTRDPG